MSALWQRNRHPHIFVFDPSEPRHAAEMRQWANGERPRESPYLMSDIEWSNSWGRMAWNGARRANGKLQALQQLAGERRKLERARESVRLPRDEVAQLGAARIEGDLLGL